MKKIHLIFAVLLSTAAMAQESTTVLDTLQSPVHLREVPKHNLRIAFGIAEPLSTYQNVANTGLSFALGYDLHFTKNWAMSVQLDHTYNEFGIARQPDLEYVQMGDDNWSSLGLSVGPQFSFQSNRFQLDLFARGGLLFLGETVNSITAQTLPPQTAVQVDSGNMDGANFLVNGGVRFNYYFRRSVQLFFEAQYSTSVEDIVEYNTFNGDKFVTGRFNNTILSVGVKFAIGKKYSSGELRIDDYPDLEIID